jgi:hypothetical protein
MEPRSIQPLFDLIRDHIADIQFQVTVSFLQFNLEVISGLIISANLNLRSEKTLVLGSLQMSSADL